MFFTGKKLNALGGFFLFFFFFLAVLGLYHGTRLFSSLLHMAVAGFILDEVSRGSPPVVACGFLLWSRLEGSSVRAQELGHTGLVAPRHVGSSQTRD